MFLEPFPKSPCQFTYVLLTTHLVTLEHVDYPTFLSDLSLSLGASRLLLMMLPPLKCIRTPSLPLTFFKLSLGPLVYGPPWRCSCFVFYYWCQSDVWYGCFGPDYYYAYSCCWSEVHLRPKWGTCSCIEPSWCNPPLPEVVACWQKKSPDPICWGVKDTVFSWKIMMAVPMDVLVSMGGFPMNRG